LSSACAQIAAKTPTAASKNVFFISAPRCVAQSKAAPTL
jgi:hypothetical protein